MNKKGQGMIIVLLVVIVIIGVVGYIGSRMMKPAPTAQIVPTQAINKGDIDRSGAADEEDRIMIRKELGCIKTQPCWNKTIGKTKDGDNPLYVFDLDLDADGSITQKDIDLVK
jgi:hypothetical protein